jgi:hypothetical protein
MSTGKPAEALKEFHSLQLCRMCVAVQLRRFCIEGEAEKAGISKPPGLVL